MLLEVGQGGLEPTQNLGLQLTLFQPGGTNYAHHTTASPLGFENLAASLEKEIHTRGKILKNNKQDSSFIKEMKIHNKIDMVGKSSN